MNIHDTFSSLIGQENAKLRLSASINSAENEGTLENLLIKGEAGLGKTALVNAYLNAMRELGYDVLSFSDPAEFRKLGSEAYSSLVQLFTESERFVLYIDEAHGLMHKPTVQTDKILRALMACGDGNQHGKTVRFDDEITFTFSPKRGSIILSTNLPGVLPDALQSRYPGLTLEHYTESELVEILKIMLARFDFRAANDKTLASIARCGRGTARIMEKIVNLLRTMVVGKNTINQDDVWQALKLAQMFPAGITKAEIDMMRHTFFQPRPEGILKQMLPSVDKDTFKNSKAYLMSKRFLAPVRGGFLTTETGKDYFNKVHKLGFSIDIPKTKTAEEEKVLA